MDLPTRLEQITPQWLSSVVTQSHHDGELVDAVVTRVIPGTTTKVLVDATFRNPDGRVEQVALCVKGGFDDALRPVFGSSYVAEARFYAEVGSRIDAPLPRCWFAGSDASVGQGIVIMDDLAASGATFGDPSQTWDASRVAAALALQARWQAQTWGADAARFPSLCVGSYVRQPAQMLFTAANWDAVFADQAHLQRMPVHLRDRSRVHDALLQMWQMDDEQGVACLSHADPHVGNTFLDASGQPGFLDWQSASLAPAMDDVAYFLVGAMSVQDRRQHERSLVDGYLDCLERELGCGLDRQAYWEDYKRHCLHGLVWTVVPPQLQPPGYRALMTDRYVAAIVDHDSVALLV